jgi:hypothetical protein
MDLFAIGLGRLYVGFAVLQRCDRLLEIRNVPIPFRNFAISVRSHAFTGSFSHSSPLTMVRASLLSISCSQAGGGRIADSEDEPLKKRVKKCLRRNIGKSGENQRRALSQSRKTIPNRVATDMDG